MPTPQQQPTRVPRVLIYVPSESGMAHYAADPGVDVEFIDGDNIDAGDPPVELLPDWSPLAARLGVNEKHFRIGPKPPEEKDYHRGRSWDVVDACLLDGRRELQIQRIDDIEIDGHLQDNPWLDNDDAAELFVCLLAASGDRSARRALAELGVQMPDSRRPRNRQSAR